MPQFQNEELVREYVYIRHVYAHCKSCDKPVGGFEEFKQTFSRRNWAGKLD